MWFKYKPWDVHPKHLVKFLFEHILCLDGWIAEFMSKHPSEIFSVWKCKAYGFTSQNTGQNTVWEPRAEGCRLQRSGLNLVQTNSPSGHPELKGWYLWLWVNSLSGDRSTIWTSDAQRYICLASDQIFVQTHSLYRNLKLMDVHSRLWVISCLNTFSVWTPEVQGCTSEALGQILVQTHSLSEHPKLMNVCARLWVKCLFEKIPYLDTQSSWMYI